MSLNFPKWFGSSHYPVKCVDTMHSTCAEYGNMRINTHGGGKVIRNFPPPNNIGIPKHSTSSGDSQCHRGAASMITGFHLIPNSLLWLVQEPPARANPLVEEARSFARDDGFDGRSRFSAWLHAV